MLLFEGYDCQYISGESGKEVLRAFFLLQKSYIPKMKIVKDILGIITNFQ